MRNLLLMMLLCTFAAMTCVAQTPKGYKHYNLADGKIELAVPESYSKTIDTTFNTNPNGKLMYSIKLVDNAVRAGAVEIAVNFQIDSSKTMEALQQVITHLADQDPAMKIKKNDIISLNGRRCLISAQTTLVEGKERNYSCIIFAIENGEPSLVSMAYEGEVTAEQQATIEVITNSIKFKK